MRQCNRKYRNVVSLLLTLDNFLQRQGEFQLSQLEFDLHFPEAHYTEQQSILTILA